MKLARPPRPSVRQLGTTLVLLGVVAGLAFLVVPVHTALDDNPLLRLAPFSPTIAQGVTEVECGVPLGNLGRHPAGLSLYDLAVGDACRAAATRRAATAVAAAGVLGLLGLLGRTAGGSRETVAA